jgi:hypothetical protein
MLKGGLMSSINFPGNFLFMETKSLFKRIRYMVEIKTKNCYVCKTHLPLTDFYKDRSKGKNGLSSKCKKCSNNLKKEYDKRRKAVDPEYRKRLNKKVYERRKRNRKKDILLDLKLKLRHSIRNRIKGKGYTKKSSTYDILGIDYKGFMSHMENLFTEGMSWGNHGEWHMDHKIPIASASNEEELLKLFHYTNYQPLWAEDNIRKGADGKDGIETLLFNVLTELSKEITSEMKISDKQFPLPPKWCHHFFKKSDGLKRDKNICNLF